MPKKPNVSLNKVPTYLFHPRNGSVRGSFGNPKGAFRILDNVSNGSRSHIHEVITKDSNIKNQPKVMIVHSHDLFLDSMSVFLEAEGTFNVTTASDVAAAVKLMGAKGPFDLIIQNFDRPGPSKWDDFKQLLNHDGGQNVALMCGAKCSWLEEMAIQQEGIVGFVPRTLPIRNLIAVLKFISTGHRYALPEFSNTQSASPYYSLEQKLSYREVQVLRGIARGQTNNGIACNLGLKEPTIKLYAKNLFRKLHVDNRTKAALIAREHGVY